MLNKTSTSELPTATLKIGCPNCGWMRTEGNIKTCPKCGVTLTYVSFVKEPAVNLNVPKGVACEKATVCPDASKRCLASVNSQTLVCLPSRRWVYCYSWRTFLGLIFVKDVGVYHMASCPCCGADLVEILKKRADNV
jgi:hypothetical protein